MLKTTLIYIIRYLRGNIIQYHKRMKIALKCTKRKDPTKHSVCDILFQCFSLFAWRTLHFVHPIKIHSSLKILLYALL